MASERSSSKGGIRLLPHVGSRTERFWQRVSIGSIDDCWPWKGKLGAKGYGRFSYDHQVITASREAYTQVYGSLAPGMCALHRCDYPACCNPLHLFSGTLIDNNDDMRAKGRGVNPPVGINGGTFSMELFARRGHPRAKLTAADVLELRALYAKGATPTALAKRYGVSDTQASKIARGLTYRTLDTCRPERCVSQ